MNDAISVVIATRDRPALLERSLGEVCRRVRSGDEVIVVDSASRGDAVARIAAARPDVRYVRAETPGTSRARNVGWRAATRSMVAFIDDDCVVTDGWRDAVVRALDDASIGFVTGRVTADRAASVGISVLEDADRRVFMAPIDPSGYGHGSNMAFRRDALDAVGGFDEGMGPGTRFRAAEDQDVFWRVVRAGRWGIYDPAITVTHLQWRSRRGAIARQFAYGIGAAAMAVKMIRSGDPLGWPSLRRQLWSDGLVRMVRSLTRGQRSPTVASLVKVAGVIAGAVMAWRAPLRDGRYEQATV